VPSTFAKLLVLLVLSLALPVHGAQPRTVCTITVNSSDEAEAFKRALPASRYRFVELVEKGRRDWLASSCRQGVRCDVLVVSGHYDGEGMFFSDDVARSEHLPVGELERVACSDSCPGLFDRLQEVYLFGCHTLSAEAVKRSWDDPLRRAGFEPPAGATRLPAPRHGESSRDRMARIFKDVPVLYGFAHEAPLGPVAGDVLARYFKAGGAADVGTGRPSARLLAHFAPQRMAAARGITQRDPGFAQRRDACQFADERLSPAQKTAFVHSLLQRDPAEVVTFLGSLERFAADLAPQGERGPDVANALHAIAGDVPAKERFLAYARAAADPALRARLVVLAQQLGWLTEDQQRDEWVQLLADRLQRGARASDVDLACRLGRDGTLAQDVATLREAAVPSIRRDAMLACLGDEPARAAVLASLDAAQAEEVEAAQVLLQHRPVQDAAEFRRVADTIARMQAPDLQARALDALARDAQADHGSATLLARLFPAARSLALQRSIASVLLRADLRVLGGLRLGERLREHRLRSPEGRDIIDVLIDRLAAFDAGPAALAARH
jgi:hypothetical protein